MKSYQYPNKYNKITYFEINETEMTIKNTNISNNIIEYNFKYQDISEYNIYYISGGLYRINFNSSNKKIKETREEKVSYISFFSIIVGENTEISLGGHFIFNKESETNIRKVIRDNTPLISQQDEIDKTKDAITEKYNESTEDTMGTIHITGLRKERDTYIIKINNVEYITLYTTKQYKILEENGIKTNEKSDPCWIDNKTVAFKIPFGEWNISYSCRQYYGEGFNDYKWVSTKNNHVTINKEHTTISLKIKSGLFRPRLIEI